MHLSSIEQQLQELDRRIADAELGIHMWVAQAAIEHHTRVYHQLCAKRAELWAQWRKLRLSDASDELARSLRRTADLVEDYALSA